MQSLIDLYEFSPDDMRSKIVNGMDKNSKRAKTEKSLKGMGIEVETIAQNLLIGRGLTPRQERKRLNASSKFNRLAPETVNIIHNIGGLKDYGRTIYSRNYHIALGNYYASHEALSNDFDNFVAEVRNANVRYKNSNQVSEETLFGYALGIAGLYAVGKMFVDGTKDAWANSSDYSYSGSSASSSSQSAPFGNSSSSTRNSGAQSGYKWLEEVDYSRGQKIIARGKCNNGSRFNVEYYPDNGYSSRFYIYSTSGSSKDDVASKFCS